VDWETLLPPVAGVALGWILGVFTKPIQDWYYKPKLSITYDNVGPGYSVPTVDGAGRKFTHLRVAVKNDGMVTAKNVRVEVTKLVLQTTAPDVVFDTEVLELPFAITHKVEADIPRGAQRFVDLCRVHLEIVPLPYSESVLEFCFKQPPNYFPEALQDGIYTVSLLITADNSEPIIDTMKFNLTGRNVAFR